MAPPKKETAQEKFQRLREKDKADMLEKLQRIQNQQKVIAFSKSKPKDKERKPSAEVTETPLKGTEEKPVSTPEKKIQIKEHPETHDSHQAHKPLHPSHPTQILRNVRVRDNRTVDERLMKIHENHQKCTNCCGGLPGRGPGSGRIGGGGGGHCCGSTQMNSNSNNHGEERLRGGGDSGNNEESEREKSPVRIRGGCGSCLQPSKPYFPPSCIHGPINRSYPKPCWRSHRRQTSCQKYESQQIESLVNTNSKCPCGSCGGTECLDNHGKQNESGCCNLSQFKGSSCKCICQSCKSFQPQGGCGGQSCGKTYSCSGSGGGESCFPRNYRRRNGSQCCGGTGGSSTRQHRSGCC